LPICSFGGCFVAARQYETVALPQSPGEGQVTEIHGITTAAIDLCATLIIEQNIIAFLAANSAEINCSEKQRNKRSILSQN
jgi:hypothetical protein